MSKTLTGGIDNTDLNGRVNDDFTNQDPTSSTSFCPRVPGLADPPKYFGNVEKPGGDLQAQNPKPDTGHPTPTPPPAPSPPFWVPVIDVLLGFLTPRPAPPPPKPTPPTKLWLSATISKDCTSEPKTITVPGNINKEFAKLWSESFPGGKSQEHGGTLSRDSHGNITLVNQSSGQSGLFTPNRTVPAGSHVAGLFHTHPYDASEGGYKGVSFSGADIALVINNREPSLVQSGDRQFLILPTNVTPSSVNYATLNSTQNARINAITHKHPSIDFAAASRQAARETARKYHMAYYEGKNGVLRKTPCK